MAASTIDDPLIQSSRDSFTCGRNSTGLGEPIGYRRAFSVMAYFMCLDQDGIRITPEEVFFLLFALSGATALREAPFKSYFGLYPAKSRTSNSRATFADEIPTPIRDCTYLRSAIEILHPKKALSLKTAGFHLEEFFYSAFTNLFAGFLPSQSLFRLWDLLFCVVISPRQLVDSPISYSDLQRKAGYAARAQPKRVCFSSNCSAELDEGFSALELTLHDGEYSAASIREFFGTSTGRRIMVAFSFSLISSVLDQLPLDPTAKEIRDSLMAHLVALRDPSEIVLMIEKGDFYLFTSEANQRHIDVLCNTYLQAKANQLELHVNQNKLLHDIISPVYEECGHVVPSQVAVSFNRNYSGTHDLFQTIPVSPGIATSDLKTIMYPMLKYQALYAPPVLRSLPPGILGRVLIKIDEFEIFGEVLNSRPVICIKFVDEQQQLGSDDFMNSPRFIFQRQNLFLFNITTPPPYTFDVSIFTDQGELIAKLKDGVYIPKLLSQGSTFRSDSSLVFLFFKF